MRIYHKRLKDQILHKTFLHVEDLQSFRQRELISEKLLSKKDLELKTSISKNLYFKKDMKVM